MHGTGSFWTSAVKSNDIWIWPPGVRNFNWHPDSSAICTQYDCNYAVLTNRITDTGLALQVLYNHYILSITPMHFIQSSRPHNTSNTPWTLLFQHPAAQVSECPMSS